MTIYAQRAEVLIARGVVVAPEVEIDPEIAEKRRQAETFVRFTLKSAGFLVDDAIGDGNYDLLVNGSFLKLKSSAVGVCKWLDQKSLQYNTFCSNESLRQIKTILAMAKNSETVINCQFWKGGTVAKEKITSQMRLWLNLTDGQRVAKDLKNRLLEDARVFGERKR